MKCRRIRRLVIGHLAEEKNEVFDPSTVSGPMSLSDRGLEREFSFKSVTIKILQARSSMMRIMNMR